MSTKCELHTEGGALENHNAEDEQEEKLTMIKSEELRGRRKTRKRGSPKSQEQRVSENGRRPSCGEGREQGDSSESSFSGAGARAGGREQFPPKEVAYMGLGVRSLASGLPRV